MDIAMKPVSESYGWEPATTPGPEQCICCKEEIPAGVLAYRSKQPQARSWLDNECFFQWEKFGADQPLFWHPQYRAIGRITTQVKQSRAARERELAKRIEKV